MLIKSFVIILVSCSCVLTAPIKLSDNANDAVKEFERIIEDLEHLFAEVIDRSEQQFRLDKTHDELLPPTEEVISKENQTNVGESTRKLIGFGSLSSLGSLGVYGAVQPQQPQITYIAAPAPAPVPVVIATPAPVVAVTPAPVVAVTPAPVVAVTPAPVVAVTPAPVVTVAPAPVVTVAPAPVVTVVQPAVAVLPPGTYYQTAPQTQSTSLFHKIALLAGKNPNRNQIVYVVPQAATTNG